MTTCCRVCHSVKRAEEFPPHILKRKLDTCRACTKLALAQRRGKGDPIKHILFNLKQYGRVHGLPEVHLWTREHVQTLLDKVYIPRVIQQAMDEGKFEPKYRIVHTDKTKPLMPDNCVIKLFGQ